MHLVSVIIPTKNEEKNISRCLISVKKQNFPCEIIVVDNYSADKTVALAKNYTALVFCKGNERSAQRNFGAKKAHGKWLLFIDADNQLAPNVIREALNTASKNNLDAVIIPERVKGKTFWAKCLDLEKQLYQNQQNILAARFFKKETFLKFGGYDENLIAGEDWDLHQRMTNAGFKVFKIKSTMYNLELDTSLVKILKKKFYYAKHIKKYAKKHPYLFIKQANLLLRLASLSKMIKDPVHALGLIFLKTAEAVIGIVGMIF